MKKLILVITLLLSINSYTQIDHRTDLEKTVYEASKLSIENGLEYNYYSIYPKWNAKILGTTGTHALFMRNPITLV